MPHRSEWKHKHNYGIIGGKTLYNPLQPLSVGHSEKFKKKTIFRQKKATRCRAIKYTCGIICLPVKGP